MVKQAAEYSSVYLGSRRRQGGKGCRRNPLSTCRSSHRTRIRTLCGRSCIARGMCCRGTIVYVFLVPRSMALASRPSLAAPPTGEQKEPGDRQPVPIVARSECPPWSGCYYRRTTPSRRGTLATATCSWAPATSAAQHWWVHHGESR